MIRQLPKFVRSNVWLSLFLMVLAQSVASVRAAQLKYEMSVNPDDGSLGAGAMSKAGDGWGSIAAGDFNDPPAAGLGTGAGGYAPVGFARFVDSGNTGRNGYFRANFAGNWTADVRMFVEQSTSGTGTIGNLGVGTADGRGRAIGFLTNNDSGQGATGNGFRFQVRSAGVISEVNVPNNNPSGQYHSIRISMKFNSGTSLYDLLLYDLEHQNTPGHWDLLLTQSITGATGRPAPNEGGFNQGGLALGGMHSSSETTAGKDIYDFVRIDDSNALGETDPIIPGPCAPPPGLVWADIDQDGDVDLDDFGVLQRCYTGDAGGHPPIPPGCACLDRGNEAVNSPPVADGAISSADEIGFLNCVTGASVPWSQGLTPNCNNN